MSVPRPNPRLATGGKPGDGPPHLVGPWMVRVDYRLACRRTAHPNLTEGTKALPTLGRAVGCVRRDGVKQLPELYRPGPACAR